MENLNESYQEFFREKLDKFGVSSPAELSSQKKTQFFNQIKNEWKGLNESSDYQKFFLEKLQKYGVESPAQLSAEDRKKLFTEVEQKWTDEDGNGVDIAMSMQQLNESVPGAELLGKLTVVFDNGTQEVYQSKYIKAVGDQSTDTFVSNVFENLKKTGMLRVMIFTDINNQSAFYYHHKISGQYSVFAQTLHRFNATPQLMDVHYKTNAMPIEGIFEELPVLKNNPELYDLLPINTTDKSLKFLQFIQQKLRIVYHPDNDFSDYNMFNSDENAFLDGCNEMMWEMLGDEQIYILADKANVYTDNTPVIQTFAMLVDSYYYITSNWDARLNDDYPFHRSFDEMEIPTWCQQYLPAEHDNHSFDNIAEAVKMFESAIVAIENYIGEGIIQVGINYPFERALGAGLMEDVTTWTEGFETSYIEMSGIFQRIMNSHLRIVDLWEDELNIGYPFNRSFDGLGIADWCKSNGAIFDREGMDKIQTIDTALNIYLKAFNDLVLIDYEDDDSYPFTDHIGLILVVTTKWINDYVGRIRQNQYIIRLDKFEYDEILKVLTPNADEEELRNVLEGYLMKTRRVEREDLKRQMDAVVKHFKDFGWEPTPGIPENDFTKGDKFIVTNKLSGHKESTGRSKTVGKGTELIYVTTNETNGAVTCYWDGDILVTFSGDDFSANVEKVDISEEQQQLTDFAKWRRALELYREATTTGHYGESLSSLFNGEGSYGITKEAKSRFIMRSSNFGNMSIEHFGVDITDFPEMYDLVDNVLNLIS